MSNGYEDRRNYYRWECEIPCQCQTNGHTTDARIVNLSFNGACLEEAAGVLRKGCDFDLNFRAAGQEVCLTGQVVYRIEDNGASRVGVEFHGNWEEKIAQVMPLFESFVNESAFFDAVPSEKEDLS